MPQFKDIKVDLLRASNHVEATQEYVDVRGWNNQKFKLTISFLSHIETTDSTAEFKHKKMLRSAL